MSVPTPESTTAAKLADLHARIAQGIDAPAAAAAAKQGERGKGSARSRIDSLLDEGSFTEIDAFARHRSTAFGLAARRPYGDGVVIGHGTIDGRRVCVYSQDFSVFGGSLGEVHGATIAKIQDFALRTGVPRRTEIGVRLITEASGEFIVCCSATRCENCVCNCCRD